MLSGSGADRAARGGQAPGADGTAEVLAAFFLKRFARLLDLERQWRLCIESPPPRLLAHALYSTYTDCVRLGRRAEAQQLLGSTAREE